WHYVDPASGRLPEGGSYVTLRAPSSGRGGADWSTVVETTQATGTQQLHLRPGRGLRPGPLHVWCSDLDSDDPRRWFARQPGPAAPTTLVGDPTWWGDYTASVSALPVQAPWVELLARVDSARGGAIGGYALRLSPDGRWQLTDETALRAPAPHDSGRGIPV